MRPFLTLHHPAAARRYYENGVWRSDTFYGLLAGHAAARPDVVAARDGRREVTWGELLAWTDGTAARFAELGLVGGDRVSIWMSNRLEAIVAFLACSRLGLACNPSLHRTYTQGEIAALLDRLSARVLITERGWGADGAVGDLEAATAEVTSLRAIFYPDNFPVAGPCDAPVVSDPDKVTYLAFTSGTTGAPKCVMHSDNTILANARDLVRDWGHDQRTRLLSLSPLSHHIAWVGVSQWLLSGCTFITDDPPAGLSRVDWIRETRATYVMGVPTHAMDILAEQRRRNLPDLGDVAIFYMAGSPIPPSVAEAFVQQGIKPQNVYGMTENSSHQYTHPTDSTEVIVATCGRGGPAYEVRVFDVANPDREVATGTEGQIGGRGGALALGYLDNQAATEQSFNRDGWFMSGDLGVLDLDGNLSIQGRLKDLIIRGGHNIYPSHIEALALRHPEVGRCAAFPVPDERLGERVCLAVLGAVTAEAVLEHLAAEGLSKYDMPEYFIRLPSFPLTASGKIVKRELIALAKRGEIVPEPVRYKPKETA